MGDQAPVAVTATSNKKLMQQAFHRSLFRNRPRSASLGRTSSHGDINPSEIQTTQSKEKTIIIESADGEATKPLPSRQQVPYRRNKT